MKIFASFLLLLSLPGVFSLGEGFFQKKQLQALEQLSLSLSQQQQQQQQQRKLQDDCTFEMAMAEECEVWEFCGGWVADNLGPAAWYCEGSALRTWFMKVEMSFQCYQAPEDTAPQRWTPNLVLPETGYCANETMFFNFTQDTLNLVEIQQVITHPEEKKGNIRFVYDYETCPADESRPGWAFGANKFCPIQCPFAAGLDGMDCDSTCTECSTTGPSFTCTNLHPELTSECDGPMDPMFVMMGKALMYFAGTLDSPSDAVNSTMAPTASPVIAPTKSPVVEGAPTGTPVSAPSMAPSVADTDAPAGRPTGTPTVAPTSKANSRAGGIPFLALVAGALVSLLV